MQNKLLCEQNTPKVERLVRAALSNAIRLGSAPASMRRRDIRTFFEHGQWWIEDARTGAQWSVNDASPGEFSFEQVTRGEEL